MATPPRIIHQWPVGKRTSKGRPIPHEVIPTVVVIPSRERDEHLNAVDRAEANRFLDRLEEEGVLVTYKRPHHQRRTARLRKGDSLGGTRAVLVFRGEVVPKIRPTRPAVVNGQGRALGIFEI